MAAGSRVASRARTHEKKLQPDSATQSAWQSSADVIESDTSVVPENQPGNAVALLAMILSIDA